MRKNSLAETVNNTGKAQQERYQWRARTGHGWSLFIYSITLWTSIPRGCAMMAPQLHFTHINIDFKCVQSCICCWYFAHHLRASTKIYLNYLAFKIRISTPLKQGKACKLDNYYCCVRYIPQRVQVFLDCSCCITAANSAGGKPKTNRETTTITVNLATISVS